LKIFLSGERNISAAGGWNFPRLLKLYWGNSPMNYGILSPCGANLQMYLGLFFINKIIFLDILPI